jgi:hypothetical protein
MRVLKAFIFVAFAAVSAVWCCISPANIEGVAFTSGEKIELENLTRLGAENVNYYIDGEQPHVAVRYVSHYDARAMVYVGNYGLSYQQDVHMNCMGVILPLADGAEPHEQIDAGEFNFAEAVSVELQWLTENGVVTLSQETITGIHSALAEAGNGGVQYWTHAEEIQGYNAWYTYDEATGQWATGTDGVFGVRGVNTIQEVDAVSGCSVVKPAAGLPPETLGAAAAAIPRHTSPDKRGAFRVLSTAHGSAAINFSRALQSPGALTLRNCAGAVVARLSIPAGARRCALSQHARMTPGFYWIEVSSGKSSAKLFAPLLQ